MFRPLPSGLKGSDEDAVAAFLEAGRSSGRLCMVSASGIELFNGARLTTTVENTTGPKQIPPELAVSPALKFPESLLAKSTGRDHGRQRRRDDGLLSQHKRAIWHIYVAHAVLFHIQSTMPYDNGGKTIGSYVVAAGFSGTILCSHMKEGDRTRMGENALPPQSAVPALRL